MTVRIGINGFGRIGRNLFRVARDRRAIAEVVAVNDLADAETLAHLLRHDSVLGHFPGAVGVTGSGFDVDGQAVVVLSEPAPVTSPGGASASMSSSSARECIGSRLVCISHRELAPWWCPPRRVTAT